MGRKATFDRETAIKKAMLAFWQNGYDKTSLEDLLQAMDIKISSFYNSFHSKESLFFEALQFYRASFGRERLHLLLSQELTAQESLLHFFDHLIYKTSKLGYPPGCFMMKTAANLSDPKSKVGVEVSSSIFNLEKGFSNVLKRGIASGEFRSIKPKELSRVLVAASYGISILRRTQKTKKELYETAKTLVDSFVKK